MDIKDRVAPHEVERKGKGEPYSLKAEYIEATPTSEQREAAQRFWDSLILPLARQLEGEHEPD
jgi:hypothetical protein